MRDVVAIDFETYPIAQRPAYPPRPVGASIKLPGEASRYMAWGHVSGGNTCTEADAAEVLHKVWDSGAPLLFHNAKFDLEVAQVAFGLPILTWQRIHDTMFLAFLADPHAHSLALKPLAEKLLGWAPEERDDVAAWVWGHRAALIAEHGGTVSRAKAGAWIWAVPGTEVAPYAEGDTERTFALYQHLLPQIERAGMAEAYARERQLLPMLLANEQEGMRVDLERLEADIYAFSSAFDGAEDWLRGELRAGGLNFDADQDVASVLVERGIVMEGDFPRTAPSKAHPAGQLSMSKENLRPESFTGNNGAQIASVLGYRNRLATCLKTFMTPWRDQARINGGRITTNWNQTRGGEGGTRTGRPSTNKHNFLNISKSFDGRDDGYVHPEGMPPLPLCRSYIMPDEGHIFLHRDFSGQELRVFAHFEQGALWQAYQDDPKTDPHAFIGAELSAVTGRELGRGVVKTLNFQGIYGGGLPLLQRKLRVTHAEAAELKAFHNRALPGRLILNDEITRLVRRGEPIRTWGGRLYYPEPNGPDGRDKIYKLINYLVQGSAADLTKQVMIDWHDHPDRTARFMVAVYDEIDASAPTPEAEAQMALLREVMEATRLSVPMRSDGKWGLSWGSLTKCN
jgi:DNA polymerase I-like protein with 3'-5' exonuclease and polymerase domains